LDTPSYCSLEGRGCIKDCVEYRDICWYPWMATVWYWGESVTYRYGFWVL